MVFHFPPADLTSLYPPLLLLASFAWEGRPILGIFCQSSVLMARVCRDSVFHGIPFSLRVDSWLVRSWNIVYNNFFNTLNNVFTIGKNFEARWVKSLSYLLGATSIVLHPPAVPDSSSAAPISKIFRRILSYTVNFVNKTWKMSCLIKAIAHLIDPHDVKEKLLAGGDVKRKKRESTTQVFFVFFFHNY